MDDQLVTFVNELVSALGVDVEGAGGAEAVFSAVRKALESSGLSLCGVEVEEVAD